jgi:hypothetical protein
MARRGRAAPARARPPHTLRWCFSVSDTNREYFYDYADQDPINDYDLSGLYDEWRRAGCGGCEGWANGIEDSSDIALAKAGEGEAAADEGVPGETRYRYRHKNHFPRYNTRKEAEQAARRAGQGKPENHPDDPHGPHYHATDQKGNPLKDPNVHYKYPNGRR